MDRVTKRAVWVLIGALTIAGLQGCPGAGKTPDTAAVPAKASVTTLTVNGDPVPGRLANGQSAWFMFAAKANTDYTVGVSGNTGAYIAEGFLVQQYYILTQDAKGKDILTLVNMQAKSAMLYPKADTDCYILLTNNGSTDDKTEVNYSIGVNTSKPVAAEGEIETLEKKDFKNVVYTEVALQSGVMTWVTFSGTKGDNVHLATKDARSNARIAQAFLGDLKSRVAIVGGLNLLNLPETGTYTLGLTTADDFELAQVGIVLVSGDIQTGAEVTLELKSAAKPAFTDIALLQGATVWVKYVGKKGDNLFVDIRNGGGNEVLYLYKDNLLVIVGSVNNLPADGTYFIPLVGSGVPTPYVETQVGLELVSTQPAAASDVKVQLAVADQPANIVYQRITVTRFGSTYVKFDATLGDNIQFSTDGGVAGNLYQAGDLTTPVPINNLPSTGTYVLQVRSGTGQPKSEIHVGVSK